MVNVSVIVGLVVGDFYYKLWLIMMVNGRFNIFDIKMYISKVIFSVKKWLFVF